MNSKELRQLIRIFGREAKLIHIYNACQLIVEMGSILRKKRR